MLEIRYVTDMFIDNILTCMHYHSDGRRQDGRMFGRTNERKENIQTYRVTTISHKNMHTGGRMDTRTDGHIYR